ncbi:MAG: hypothetical protein QOJ50_3957 [Cryptosporangiaceae bacterium]|jgi:hypothetical protein|nr:hypothetical protein [Cryptosporangiaceae bacterium]
MTLPATGGAPAALDPPLPRDLQAGFAGTGNVRCRMRLGATAGLYEEIRHGTGFAPRPGQFDRVLRNRRGVF